MFKNILIYLKENFILKNEILEFIRELSQGSNIKIINFNELRKEHLQDVDLIIAMGGDGTFLKIANLVQNSLIIGINTHPQTSEGILTSLNINEISKLKELFSGNFEIIKRQRATAKINGRTLDEHALNEIYIGSKLQFHTSRYKIKFNEQEEEHRSSGILISTGTGSSVWFSSAGGETFNCDKEMLGFIVREPYRGKRIYIPKILKGHLNKDEKLTIESTKKSDGILAINNAIYDFNEGDIAEIKLSDKPLKVIKLKS